MRNIIFTLSVLLFFQSCVFSRMDDSIDLGDNYRYIQDAPQMIIFHKTEEYEGVGVEIVPPVVLAYKFNDRYIISKSQEVDEITGSKEGKPIHYWLIDKETKGAAVEPMDSMRFYNRLIDLNIDLSFKDKK